MDAPARDESEHFRTANAMLMLKMAYFCIYLAKNFHFRAKIALFANKYYDKSIVRII